VADQTVAEIADGVTANASDKIYALRTPFGLGNDVSITPAYIRAYLIALANTWAATQTITPAVNTNALAVSTYSLTGANAQSLFDLAGTWNTSGTPTAIKLVMTDTASNAASMLVELFVGANRRFALSKAGNLSIPSSGYLSLHETFGNGSAVLSLSADTVALRVSRSDGLTSFLDVYARNHAATSAGSIGFWSGTNPGAAGSMDTALTREAAAKLGSTASFRILNGTAIPAGGTASAGYKFSSATDFGIFPGSGAPTLAAAKGSLYLRSDGSGPTDRAYINTDGSTTWTNLVTAA
jgi:hypothetical protein